MSRRDTQAYDKLRGNALHRSYRHMVDQLGLEPSVIVELAQQVEEERVA